MTLGTMGLVSRWDADWWTNQNGNATVCRDIDGTVMTRELGGDKDRVDRCIVSHRLTVEVCGSGGCPVNI